LGLIVIYASNTCLKFSHHVSLTDSVTAELFTPDDESLVKVIYIFS